MLIQQEKYQQNISPLNIVDIPETIQPEKVNIGIEAFVFEKSFEKKKRSWAPVMYAEFCCSRKDVSFLSVVCVLFTFPG